NGQVRKSDEPYIIHPVEVAISLAHLNADVDTICSGLLHDVIEDCEVKGAEIEGRFGADVRKIVEGVTKLGKFSFSSKEERQAENFRKLLVAIAEDVRVVLVKLADRLHNMKTLDYMKPAKQAEIAQETLEIYAPLANRFGLGRFKWELEDLSLKYLYPSEYENIENLVADSRQERETYVNDVVQRLRKELAARNITAEVYGRPKHLFGIWKKMKKQNKDFEELYDVFAIRVIIESQEDKNYCELQSDPDTQKCYEVMGLVHSLFRPIPGRFKDYIAMPKQNSYQSLHTAVMGLSGRPVEIQIRTRRMHHVAEYGIAAHWRYKESGSVTADSQVDRKLAWLRQLVEWQQDLKDAREYMDTVKMDLFADEVFVFSPRGDVFDLPKGSTPIDFAYRVHTEVGNHVTGARINDRMVPLATPMRNGDIVEIITSKSAHPRMDWLNIAITHSAKSRIRQWFKKHHREEHIQQGKQMLEAELGKTNYEDLLKSEKLKDIGKRLNVSEPDDILAALGYGDLSLSQIVNRIRELELLDKNSRKESLPTPQQLEPSRANKSSVSSLSGLMHHLAQCCNPVPGEPISGIVTRGSGITVHRADCTNLTKVEKDRRMDLTWSDAEETKYPAYLVVECIDRVGMAKDILQRISDNKINLSDLRVETHHQKKIATIHLIVEVKDIQQLDHISTAIGQIADVLLVRRQNHKRRT
ncbi:MAG: bifunctional (p)ppGpp synthetase/guanosine-3',5'-bis(diphosphate) 3'-pyrophosphohydrolase, partial [Candidatus Obscuribacterales bacterium]|nr:bifunctional (p)ppGpp synthetase/guanosine-3',5'-bis(diphosphate) 3'-pyrophosphohydrolase [Candidatus Obscuribacterales bacterium]